MPVALRPQLSADTERTAHEHAAKGRKQSPRPNRGDCWTHPTLMEERTVANIKSQKKRILTAEKARQRNRACKSALKTAVRRVREAVAEKDGVKAYVAAQEACRLLDKAAGKGIIHKNQAANRKSGVMQLANTVVTPEDIANAPKREKRVPEVKGGTKKAARKAEKKAAYAAADAEKAKRREATLKLEKAAHDRKAAEEAAAAAEEEAAE